MNKTVFISPGVGEGPWHVQLLADCLLKHGFALTDQLTHADIVIAHSGGCYVVPKSERLAVTLAKPKFVLWIDPPYWPGKPVLSSTVQVMWLEIITSIRNKTLKFCIVKTIWNIWYIIKEPLYGLRVIRARQRMSLLALFSSPNNVVVRNEDDAWCAPDIDKYINNSKLLRLPGQHDDCWYHPDVYVQILADQFSVH